MVTETQVGFLMSTNEIELVRGKNLDKPGGDVDLTRATGLPRDTVRPRERTVEHHYFKEVTALETLADHGLEP
jgi:hypothetical protein